MSSHPLLQWAQKVGYGRFTYRMLLRQFSKRIRRADLFLKLRNGKRIRLPNSTPFSSVAWVTNGAIDDGAEWFLHELHPRGAFLDVGAHIGFYSVLMSDIAVRVYAFEPDPRVVPTLVENLSEVKNATHIAAAVGDTNGSAKFILASSFPHSKLGTIGPGQPTGEESLVRVIALDDWVRDEAVDAPIGSIKIDVEGGEEKVLRGARQIIRRDRPCILVETDRQAFRAYQDLFNEEDYRVAFVTKKRASQPASFQVSSTSEFASDPTPWSGMLLISRKEHLDRRLAEPSRNYA